MIIKGTKSKIIEENECIPNESELKYMITEIINDMQRHANSCPDIIKLFLEANPGFLRKVDRKALPPKEEVNLNSLISQANSQKLGQDRKDDKKKTLSLAKQQTKKEGNKDSKKDSSSNAAANLNNLNLLNNKEEKQRFSKAEEIKKAFWMQYKQSMFEANFSDKIKQWKDCKNF